MGRKQGRGKFGVYVGLRCDEATAKAMVKVARQKHAGNPGEAWRAAARAYAGLASPPSLKKWKDVRHSKPQKVAVKPKTSSPDIKLKKKAKKS